MADLHSRFQTYNNNLQVPASKQERMKTSRMDIESRVRRYFSNEKPQYKLSFFIQGSTKTNTMIRTKDDTCDQDFAVFLDQKPTETCATIQTWVKKALDGHAQLVQHLEKCIRVHFSAGYHIDLPVFYERPGVAHPRLAVKNGDWQPDDPREFIAWFQEKQKASGGQLVRIVRYLKGWGDHKRNKMPSGLEVTVLAARNLKPNDRDDLCLKNTLAAIQQSLRDAWRCNMPTTPHEDLFAKYDPIRRSNFRAALDAFVTDAATAVNEADTAKAARLWGKHLGDRFPLV